jgi:hypothetical protein
VQISCFQCYLRLLFAWSFASQCVTIVENYTNSKMTDMVLCYVSADGTSLVSLKVSPNSRDRMELFYFKIKAVIT